MEKLVSPPATGMFDHDQAAGKYTHTQTDSRLGRRHQNVLIFGRWGGVASSVPGETVGEARELSSGS